MFNQLMIFNTLHQRWS